MFEREPAATASAMVAPGKGMPAIDESSSGIIKKRFDTIGVEWNVENRRACLGSPTTTDDLAQSRYIGSMNFYDETIRQAGVQELTKAAVGCLKSMVPAAVAGMVFPSGGQSDKIATVHLNAMNARGSCVAMAAVVLSSAGAGGAGAYNAWKGQTGNVAAAQTVLSHRARMNNAARFGRYKAEMEQGALAA